MSEKLLYHLLSTTDRSQFTRDAASTIERPAQRYQAPQEQQPIDESTIWELAELLSSMQKLLVVTGAGCSTEFPSVRFYSNSSV